MSENPVLFDVNDGIATVRLNRPERLNAVTRPLMIGLADILRKLSEDDAVRVICLTGEGRGFCAGQDLSERDPRAHPDGFDLEALQIELFHPVVTLITSMPKPVLAKVNGVAAGAGASLALACDFVIAAESANFTQSFSKVGLSVDAGGGWHLTHALGPARAKAALMLAETISATEAHAMGLIYKAVPEDALDESADALLAQLARTPRMALASIKKSVAAASSGMDFEAYLKAEAAAQGAAGRHPDYAEGVLSFLEKRKPNYR